MILCKNAHAGQEQFRRAVFNLFALNQDDHSKNWAFLMDDHGQWQLAPFYDVTFSPTAYGENASAYGGYGKNPPLKTLQHLAKVAGFAHWQAVQKVIHDVLTALNTWESTANALGISAETCHLIAAQLKTMRQKLKYLWD